MKNARILMFIASILVLAQTSVVVGEKTGSSIAFKKAQPAQPTQVEYEPEYMYQLSFLMVR